MRFYWVGQQKVRFQQNGRFWFRFKYSEQETVTGSTGSVHWTENRTGTVCKWVKVLLEPGRSDLEKILDPDGSGSVQQKLWVLWF